MTNQSTPAAAAGWYPDPAGGGRSRWWDGAQWTEHYHDPYSATAVDLRAPEGTAVYTPWIWLIIFLPLVPLLGLLSIDWAGLFTFDARDPSSVYQAELGIFLSPGYLLTSLGSFVVYLLSAWFAYLDWRELARRGVPRPFHFAWVFLSSSVYVIGRSIVVNRRAGHGLGPIWALIAYFVLSIVVVSVMMVAMFSAIARVIPTIAG